MPRKKTIQPEPIESFTLDDGTIVEIRGENCKLIGRGLHNANAFITKRDKILELVASDYLTPQGRKLKPKEIDYLSSATSFARKAAHEASWGLGNEDGVDDSSLRKKLYSDIKKHITALENAINKNLNK